MTFKNLPFTPVSSNTDLVINHNDDKEDDDKEDDNKENNNY